MPRIIECMAKFTVAVAVSAALSGCLSVEEMQAMPAIRIFASAHPSAETADCIYGRILGIDRDDTIRRSEANGVRRITADQGYAASLALYDIAIFDAGNQISVELRAKGNVWGTTNEPHEISTIIERCSV